MLFQHCQFLKSAADPNGFPPDAGVEIAFVGRSNSGKSSALNTLARQKIAKTSKTPGRTQLINFFTLSETHRLVDLPGYGFAKVSRTKKMQWESFLADYLVTRECLRALVVLMDIRHPLKPSDEILINWMQNTSVDLHLVLTKADKLSRNQQQKALSDVKKRLPKHAPIASLQAFSATKRLGLEILETTLLAY